MSGTLGVPVHIDLTNDSEEENRFIPLALRGTRIPPATHVVGEPALSKQSPHQSPWNMAAGTPSRSAAGASPASNPQDMSPRSTKLSHPHAQDASPRTGFASSNLSPYMPARGSPVSRGGRNPLDQPAQNTTPKRPVAQEEAVYDIEKIVGELKNLAADMERTNAQIVKFALTEIVKKPPEQRHLSAIDHFADLPSIAEEPGFASEESLQARFRVRILILMLRHSDER